METIIQKLTGTKEDRRIFREAAKLIRQGEVVAFPTETVYGLGGNGLNPLSAARIYGAKGRPSDNPLILHISDVGEIPPLVREVPARARGLMEAFWPGPLTIILNKSGQVPRETTGGLDTVAIRMPSHPAALALIREAGVPIAAPSANASGRPSPTLARHVWEDLAGRIPLIIDGGETDIGLESTIVDLSREVPELLRPGYIGLDKLQKVLGTVAVDPAVSAKASGGAPRAPGMKYRHYAPRVPLTIVAGEDEKRAAYIHRKSLEALKEGKRIGALISRDTLPLFRSEEDKSLLLFVLGERDRDETIAHNLFALLRQLDEHDLFHVYAESFEGGPLAGAIMNRLRKAAAFDIVNV